MAGFEFNTAALSWDDISAQLTDEQRKQLKYYRLEHQVDSTNALALQQFCSVNALPAVCLSELQTQGRGRNGRTWVSPEARNIYMSLAWRFNSGIQQLQAFSLAVGVVVVESLRSYDVDARLKWPNDVLVRGRKLAGVLIESQVKSSDRVNLVIGIGINVAMSNEQAENIDQPWTDLVRENAKFGSSRSKIAGDVLSALMRLCNEYEITGLAPYKARWNEFDVCNGASVQVHERNNYYYGRCMGIDDSGALKVLVDGHERVFYAADVSIRVAD